MYVYVYVYVYGYGYGYRYIGIGLVFYVTLLVFWPDSSAFLTPFIFVSRIIGIVYASVYYYKPTC